MDGEDLLELLDGLAGLVLELVGEVLLVAEPVVDRALRAQGLAQLLLEARHLRGRDVVEETLDPREDREDLLLERPRRVLRLVERRHHPLAAGERPLRLGVELGAELGERLELAVLGKVEAQAARHLPHRLRLGVAAHATHRDADVDGRPHAREEEVGLEEDLAVRDRDHVRRDVGGDVARLGLDHRKSCERAAAELVVELARALEQPRMEVEDVAGEGLAPGGAAEEKRHLPVGVRVLREVVVHADGVLAVVEEVLAHGRTGIGRHPLDRSRLGRGGHDDDRVLHRPRLLEALVHLRHGRGLLADRDVDADHVLALLVQDRVHEDCGLPRRAVADHELALAATDGDHGVDRLDAGLERLLDRLAVDDAGGLVLEQAGLGRADRARAVERLAQRVDDAADELVPHRDADDVARALDGPALCDLLPVAEERDADVVLLEVERDARDAVLELEHLQRQAALEAVDAGDAVADLEDGSDLGEVCLDVVLLDALLENRRDLFWT